MTKPLKTTLITLSTILVLTIVGYFVANAIVTSKVENFLNTKLPENLSLDYESLDLSIWRGDVVLTQPRIVNRGSHSSKINVEVELDTLLVDGFGVWSYLVNDNIHVKSVQFRSPKFLYSHNSEIPKSEYRNSSIEQLQQEITVERFNIQDAEVIIKDFETDSLLLQLKSLTANIMAITIDSETVHSTIPFKYDDYNISYNDLFYTMGEYENLEIASASITQDKAVFDGMKMYTKYSKAKFDQMIQVERDHFNVSIASLVIEDQKFGYENDSVFYFKSPKVTFETPEMDLYRNKLIADDLTRKRLYSRMLRELKFDLTLSSVSLRNASIVYSEKVNVDMGAGQLSFTKMNVDIKNISNTYGASERTTLDIDAVFMAQTPLKVHWEFDVNDVNDAFVFRVDLGKLPAADLNAFSQPNLKVKLEGELLQTYATVSGDANTSRVDMKANYEDFKVDILDGDGEKKNKVLSAIANLFIAKNSDRASDGFREGNKEGIERDHTKSIFNFLWMSIKAGLASVLTGDGKKK